MRSTMKIGLPLLLAAVLAGTTGCATETAVENGGLFLPDVAGPQDLLNDTVTSDTVTENEALRGVVMLRDGEDKAWRFSQRVDNAIEAKLASAVWDYDGKRAITRGKAAYMVYQAIGHPGGLTLMVVGPTQRYALREMVFHGVMAPGALKDEISGEEFAAVLVRASGRTKDNYFSGPEAEKLAEGYPNFFGEGLGLTGREMSFDSTFGSGRGTHMFQNPAGLDRVLIENGGFVQTTGGGAGGGGGGGGGPGHP